MYHYHLVLGSPFLKGGPLEFLEHVSDTSGMTMVSHCESGIPVLYHFQFMIIYLCKRIPHFTSIFQDTVGQSRNLQQSCFDVSWAGIQVALQDGICGVCLLCDQSMELPSYISGKLYLIKLICLA